MSAVPLADEATTLGRGLALLRSIGPAGIASAAVLVLATFAVSPLSSHTPTCPTFAACGPGAGHVLGMTSGRDVLPDSRAQSSMLGPLAVVMISVPVGTLIAVTAAWRRRMADAVISSGLDILFAFPGILLAVLAAAVFGAGLPAATIALSVAYLPYVARVLRGAAPTERSQPYVAALEVQGYRPPRSACGTWSRTSHR